jgi:hypothetical protein
LKRELEAGRGNWGQEAGTGGAGSGNWGRKWEPGQEVGTGAGSGNRGRKWEPGARKRELGAGSGGWGI